MHIISRKQKAAQAAEHWKITYYKNGEWTYGKDRELTYKKLLSAGKAPSYSQVNKIIGNSSWTDCKCEQCGKYKDSIVELGQPQGYDTATTRVCFVCLEDAYKTFKEFLGK